MSRVTTTLRLPEELKEQLHREATEIDREAKIHAEEISEGFK